MLKIAYRKIELGYWSCL